MRARIRSACPLWRAYSLTSFCRFQRRLRPLAPVGVLEVEALDGSVGARLLVAPGTHRPRHLGRRTVEVEVGTAVDVLAPDPDQVRRAAVGPCAVEPLHLGQVPHQSEQAQWRRRRRPLHQLIVAQACTGGREHAAVERKPAEQDAALVALARLRHPLHLDHPASMAPLSSELQPAGQPGQTGRVRVRRRRRRSSSSAHSAATDAGEPSSSPRASRRRAPGGPCGPGPHAPWGTTPSPPRRCGGRRSR